MPICAACQIASSHIAPMQAIWLLAIRPETGAGPGKLKQPFSFGQF